MQQVLEAEMTSLLGAETYERNGEQLGFLQRLQGAQSEDARGQTGADGAQGPLWRVSD
jgi:hypothetical protein